MAFNFSRADGENGREEPPPPPAVPSNNTDAASTAEAGAEDRSPSAQGNVLRRSDALIDAFGGFGLDSGQQNTPNVGHARPTFARARLADDSSATTVGNRPSSSSALLSNARPGTSFGGGIGGMTQPGWATGFNFVNGQSNTTSGGINERTNPTIPAPSEHTSPFGAQTLSDDNQNVGGADSTRIPGGVDPNGGRTLPSPPAPSTVGAAGGPFAALALSFGGSSPPNPSPLAFAGGSPPAQQSVGGTGGTGLGLGHGGTNNATGTSIFDFGAGGIRGTGGTPTRETPAPPFGGSSTSLPNAGTSLGRSANGGASLVEAPQTSFALPFGGIARTPDRPQQLSTSSHAGSNLSVDSDEMSWELEDCLEDELLPASCLASVFNFMKYADVRNCLLAGKVTAVEAASHVETLNITSPSELVVPASRRFENVTEVNVLCLLSELPNEQGDVLSVETAERIVPFVSSLRKLTRCFLGGMPRQGFPHVYKRTHCVQPEDHQSIFRGLVTTFAGAFRSKALSQDLRLEGIVGGDIDGVSLMVVNSTGTQLECSDEEEDPNEPCRCCRAIVSSFPLKTVVELVYEKEVCVSRENIIEMIRSREGWRAVMDDGCIVAFEC